MKILQKSKYLLLGAILGIGAIGFTSYAAVTGAGTIGSLFELDGTDYKLIGGNIKEDTVSTIQIQNNSLEQGDFTTTLSNEIDQIGTNSGAIAENRGKIGTNSGTIAENRGYIGTNSGAIYENRGKIGTNSGAIYENRGKIGTNSGAIYENRGKIGTNSGKISENSTKIADLDIPNVNEFLSFTDICNENNVGKYNKTFENGVEKCNKVERSYKYTKKSSFKYLKCESSDIEIRKWKSGSWIKTYNTECKKIIGISYYWQNVGKESYSKSEVYSKNSTLDVNGSIKTVGHITQENTSPTTYYKDTDDDNFIQHVNWDRMYWMFDNNDNNSWDDGDDDRIVMYGTQNEGLRLGIGTSSPTATLDVRGKAKISGDLILGKGIIKGLSANCHTNNLGGMKIKDGNIYICKSNGGGNYSVSPYISSEFDSTISTYSFHDSVATASRLCGDNGGVYVSHTSAATAAKVNTNLLQYNRDYYSRGNAHGISSRDDASTLRITSITCTNLSYIWIKYTQ